MNKFTTTCIDSITKMEMILSDCNYNNACIFLEKENIDNRFGHFMTTTNRTLFLTEIRYEKANFIYDDVRGVLLRNT